MSKITREQKLEIYNKRKSGVTLQSLALEYHINIQNIKYLIRLLDQHGATILKKDKNRSYPPLLKEEIINKVLIDNHSIKSTALEYGLSSDGILHNWIRSYKENDYVIVEKTRGRRSTMKPKSNQEYKEMTLEEKVKYLENKNQYLEAENEYLKKLRAVVQARKNQQSKKK